MAGKASAPKPRTKPGAASPLIVVAALLLISSGAYLVFTIRNLEREAQGAGYGTEAPLDEPDNSAVLSGEWPPRLGETYPDLKLYDQEGNLVQLSSFKGKVLVIEMVGMTCPACQFWSGSGVKGDYPKGTPKPGGHPGFRRDFERITGLDLGSRDVIFVQLILYSMSMKAPTREAVRSWAAHFGFERSKNEVVLAGTSKFISQASYDLIPGFQLVDRNFILRYDATGHHPFHNWANELLPMVPVYVEEDPTPG